jgi:hypothetical protein
MPQFRDQRLSMVCSELVQLNKRLVASRQSVDPSVAS